MDIGGRIMLTKEEMFEAINNWVEEAGEDFLDYFESNMNEFNFMFWCLGKGYIDEEQLQAFEKDPHQLDYLMGDEEYSVVTHEEYERGYMILAEFLCSTVTYQKRVKEFLDRITRIKFEDVLKRQYHRNIKIFYVINDGERVYLDKDTPLTLEIISKAIWYEEEDM
jgi:hypothetical protein